MGQIPRADGPRTSETWIKALRSEGASREEAIADLYALLLRAARFGLRRRRAALSHVRGEELDDIATQAADDALMAVLSELDQLWPPGWAGSSSTCSLTRATTTSPCATLG
jgi:hypothetical protein